MYSSQFGKKAEWGLPTSLPPRLDIHSYTASHV